MNLANEVYTVIDVIKSFLMEYTAKCHIMFATISNAILRVKVIIIIYIYAMATCDMSIIQRYPVNMPPFCMLTLGKTGGSLVVGSDKG